MTVHGQFALARVDKSRVALRALLIGVVVSLLASIVLSTASAVDGPVMRYRSSSADGDIGDALIPGLLELEGDCLYVVQSGERYPILWPAGTKWDDDAHAVILPRGDALAVGSEIVGGGGYLDVDDVQRLAGREAAERAQECVDNTSARSRWWTTTPKRSESRDQCECTRSSACRRASAACRPRSPPPRTDRLLPGHIALSASPARRAIQLRSSNHSP